MNILFASSEMTPYAKTGGLGDVAGALPSALRRAGHGVSVVLPLYRAVREKLEGLEPTGLKLDLELGPERREAAVWRGRSADGVVVWAVEQEEFFDRPALYGEGGDYGDNDRRFIFFSKAVARLALYLNPLPDVLHLNDWQTAAAVVLAKAWGMPYKTVLTIHNLAYQGQYPGRSFPWMNLPPEWFSARACEFWGQMNLLKAGILLADEVTTVSPGYAREILTPGFGCGLHEVLRARADRLTGIVNGIDTVRWDPREDAHLPVRYCAERLEAKAVCRRQLMQECGLEAAGTEAVLGNISRLVDQKGIDLILEAMPELMRRPVAMVFLGSGDPRYEEALRGWERRHPGRVYLHVGFSEGLAHRIEGGADFFLMPSRFEPCGLNQMYSQRYGTVPVVHAVGGLRDTVQPWEEDRHGLFRARGTGLVFDHYDPGALVAAVDAGLRLQRFPAYWQQVRRNGMRRDFSWQAALPSYEAVYRRALGRGGADHA